MSDGKVTLLRDLSPAKRDFLLRRAVAEIIPESEFVDLLKFCRARGVATVVDVVIPQNARNLAELSTLLPFIDYFLPNDDEARLLTGCDDPADQARALVKAGAGTAIVTCGRNGCVAATGAICLRADVYPMPVADPSGAGDAFDAGILTGLVRGWDLRRSLRYAAALGASAVRAVGTTRGVFTAAEAEAFLAAHELSVGESAA